MRETTRSNLGADQLLKLEDPNVDGRIFFLKEKLVEDLKHHWTIEEMATSVELSLPHFQRLFKNQMGISPMQYLQNLRLEKARGLLEGTFHPIKEVGIKVGLQNNCHFAKDFKKKFGVTPSEYRRSYWEAIQSGFESDKNDRIGQGIIE